MTAGRDRDIYLSTLPSSASDRNAAIWAVGGSLVLFAAALPFVRITFPPIPAFIASYQSSLAVVYVITSVLLFSQFGILRSHGILYLANGYLFTALAIAGYALTYDDLFSDKGLFFPGPETTIWLYLVWHAGFPLFVLCYAMSDTDLRATKTRRAANRRIIWSIAGVVSFAILLLLVLTIGHKLLPPLIVEKRFSSAMIATIAFIFLTCVVAISVLLRRRVYSVLDVWMTVILSAWMFDISLSAVFNAARFDFGYYAGRIYGLFAAGAILAILLTETASLQLRLSLLMRRQAREAADALQNYDDRDRLFQAAVRSSNDAIITKSLTGIITGWNQAAERLFGYSATEAIGQRIDIIVPPERQDEENDILDRVARRQAIRNQETVRRSKDGRLLDVSLSVSPVLSASGELIGAAKVARDITDQKLNEEKFKLAVDASPSGLVMIDASGHIMLVNSRIEHLFGYARDELLGRSVDDLVPSGMPPHHGEAGQSYGDDPRIGHIGGSLELFGQTRDGKQFPIEITLHPIPSRRGTLVLAVIVDLTERRNAQRALLESERMAQVIIDTALDGFLQFDSSYNVIDLNRQAESILGWSRQQAIGTPLFDILATGHPNRHPWKLFLSQLEQGSPAVPGTRFEFSMLTKQGRELILELSLTRHVRDTGTLFNAFIRDLTAQRAAESQFRQVQKMEAIGQLTGGIAHDFNNILTVITGTIEILAQGVADQPQLRAITELIDSAAERGSELTRQLLAFSRKQPLQPTDVDINPLVIEAAKLLRPTLGEQLQIDLTLATDAWSAMVDPNQLTTAILNLALNARDATPDGGKLALRTGNLHIDGATDECPSDITPGDYVIVEVSDNGTGMDRDTLSRVFEPFFTTKEVGKGTGLGLSMVYGFAKQSNGHVTISSMPDLGTTVTLYLPRSMSNELPARRSPVDPTVQEGRESILIVEDDALVRAYVTAQIAGLGYRTFSAINAEEADAIIDSEEVLDLLFTDIVLPGGRNGRQIAEDAVRKRPGLKVLFASGYTQGAFSDSASLHNDILLLNKPYRIGELSRMIRQALGT